MDPASPRGRRADRRGLSAAGASDPFSPLELLHPRGHAATTLSLGARPLPSLVATRAGGGEQPADLVLVAPSAAELESEAPLARLVRDAAEALAPDGLAYVVVPARARRAGRSALTRAGLGAIAEFVHVPDAERTRLLVPLSRAPLRFALGRLGRRTWRWRVAHAAARLPFAARLVGRRGPTGLAGRRPGTPPLFAWLRALGTGPGEAVVQIGSRPESAGVVVYTLRTGSTEPASVAKVSRDAARLEREARALRDLGESARKAGAQIPELLLAHTVNDVGILLETPVSGRLLAQVLGGAPRRLPAALDRIARWLATWHRLSARPSQTSAPWLQREVLDPAEAVAGALDDGDEYLRRLEALCARAEGTTMPLVASHDDLTSINILAARDRLAVVDWEHARADGLPLADFVYAAADAAAAVGRHGDRIGAFEDCFVSGRRWTALVDRLERRLRDAVGLSSEAAELCFHACWARHGANELRASGGRPGEFVELAARAARLTRVR